MQWKNVSSIFPAHYNYIYTGSHSLGDEFIGARVRTKGGGRPLTLTFGPAIVKFLAQAGHDSGNSIWEKIFQNNVGVKRYHRSNKVSERHELRWTNFGGFLNAWWWENFPAIFWQCVWVLALRNLTKNCISVGRNQILKVLSHGVLIYFGHEQNYS